jgi:hypothetical protein
MNNDKKLLRLYVRHALHENRSSGRFTEGSEAQAKALGDSFKNLWSTLVGSFKKIASKSKTLLKLTKELVVTTALKPWEKAEYDEIMQQGKEEYDAIKSKYPDQSLWDSIPGDLKIALGILYPVPAVIGGTAILGAKAVKGIAGAIKDPGGGGPGNNSPRGSTRGGNSGSSNSGEINDSYRIRSAFGTSLLSEDEEKDIDNKKGQKSTDGVSKKQLKTLTKDLQSALKSALPKKLAALEKLKAEMEKSGESDKKAIENIAKQIQILKSMNI